MHRRRYRLFRLYPEIRHIDESKRRNDRVPEVFHASSVDEAQGLPLFRPMPEIADPRPGKFSVKRFLSGDLLQADTDPVDIDRIVLKPVKTAPLNDSLPRAGRYLNAVIA